VNFDRLIALVRRELEAEDVRVVEVDEDVPEGALSSLLANGKRVVVTIEGDIDREAKTRRLEMLVESFGETFRSSNASRPPPAQSLHAELQGVAQRAGATDAVVIDAQSPVVWGAAEDEEATPHLLARDNVISLDAHRTSGERFSAQSQPQPQRDPPASTRAVDAVRALTGIPTLHRGGHLHEKHVEEGFGYLARSFAGIYVIVLVFEGAFDELRAERALALSLPAIERLVTALPPLDPTPVAGAAAIRRRRR
jgi:hypothetical protein